MFKIKANGCIYLLASYVFHIRVLEVKWSDESHIFTFNAGMYWIHKSPHAFRLVHWSALHQVVCYHAKSTVTDLVVGSRKYIFCLCIPKPASRESQNPGAYPGMVLGFIFKLFDVSVWFRTWDYIYSCWYFERERGHCTVRFLWNQWNFELFSERVFFFERHASEAIAIIEYTFFQWITTFESFNVCVNEKKM